MRSLQSFLRFEMSKTQTIILMLLTLILKLKACDDKNDWLEDYLSSQEIKVVTDFTCIKHFRESLKMFKNLIRRGIQTKIVTSLDGFNHEHKTVFILRGKCGNFEEILNSAEKLNLFKHPFKWVLLNDKTEDLQKILNSYEILVDSDFIVYNCEGSVNRVFKYHANDDLIIENFNEMESNVFRRRSNLQGTLLNVCIVVTNNDTLNHLTDKRNKHIDSITKVNYVLLEHLRDVVNITLNYSIESTWGYKNDKNEWTGMMKQLVTKITDIGGTPLFFTIDRVDLIDYIAMTTPTKSKFIFREPKLSYITNVFTLPFDRGVWISTITLVALTSLFLYLTLKWERKTNQNVDDGLEATLEDATFFSYSALCQQGSPFIPTILPGRIITIFLFVSFMFLYTSYSANIVALLQSSSSSIRTLEDLLKSRLDVGVHDTVFNRFYFPNATEYTRKEIYLKKVAPVGKKDHFMTLDEGVRKIREGLFAFHMETGPGYQLIGKIFHENEKCGLQEIQFLQVIDPWLAVQKNSSYKEFFKISLKKIQETGLQYREVSQIYTKKPECMSRGVNFISVGIIDCYPAVVVLAAGIVLAFAVLCLEILIYNVHNEINKKKLLEFLH